ncbi:MULTISPECIES: hypothetical protein [Vibrio harveyi group]|uniref:Uncharacterized protein n=1 Tax=Vibrio owensii CAIM 1854 = LMG 25443 TaxID=1229493 RepID=A0A0C1ZA43_9VIBR|nr:hypothetical protein [Vibrio owensii]KIF53049.1 hypothetical protein H735_08860 [Vibrio owensii CAIM 1854 = LMG 25443]
MSTLFESISNQAGLIMSLVMLLFFGVFIIKKLDSNKQNEVKPAIKNQYQKFDNVTLNHIVAEMPQDKAQYFKAYIAEVRKRYGVNGFKVGHLGFYFEYYEQVNSSDFTSREIPSFITG